MNDHGRRFSTVRWLLLLGALVAANIVAAGLGARPVKADEAPCLTSGSNCTCHLEGTKGGQCLSDGGGKPCLCQCQCTNTCILPDGPCS